METVVETPVVQTAPPPEPKINLSGAHEAADALIDNLNLVDDTGVEPQTEAPPETPAAEAPPAEAAPAPAEAAPPVQEYEEFDYQGQRVKLSKDEANAIRLLGIRYLQELRAKEAEAQAPAPEAQAPAGPADPLKELKDEIRALKREAEDRKTREAQAESQKQLDLQLSKLRSTVEQTAFHKEFSQQKEVGEAASKLFQLYSTALQYTDQNKTPEQAVKETEELFEKLFSARQGKYVKSKVEAGRNLVEGRGSAVATPSRPLGRKDLLTGKTEEIAAAILAGANER